MSVKHREDSITGIRLREAQKTKIATSATLTGGSIVLTLPEGGVCTGTTVKFTAPCACAAVTGGLVIDGVTYQIVDTMLDAVMGIDGAWQRDAALAVVMNCEKKFAVLQTQPLTTIQIVEVTVTLSASKWSGSAAPYTQTVTVEGMAADTHGIARVNYQTATLEQRNAARYAMLCLTAQGSNTVTITADGERPTVDIPIVIRMDIMTVQTR